MYIVCTCIISYVDKLALMEGNVSKGQLQLNKLAYVLQAIQTNNFTYV